VNNRNALKQLLSENIIHLGKAAEQLEVSYQRCNTLLISDVVSIDDQEKLEALTSRFARLADLISWGFNSPQLAAIWVKL